MTDFYGRKNELAQLNALGNRKGARLIVLKGRRRVGKSRLLTEFSKEFKQVYFFSGLAPTKKTNAEMQRAEFVRQLQRLIQSPGIKTDDWGDIFWHLSLNLPKTKTLIVLDEITWMADKDPTFLGKLKNAWDLYFKQHPHLILAICGSISSWIEKNILSSTGFFGRPSLILTVEPLPLIDAIHFWPDKHKHISGLDKLKLLSITGGIPRYLEEFDPKISVEENIKQLCFTPSGILFHEFDKLFHDLFSKESSRYKDIVNCLSGGMADQESISNKIGLSQSGHLSEDLSNLAQAGFVSRDYTWSLKTGKLSKLSQYRLCDNYTRFYLKYIEPQKMQILNENYTDVSLSALPGWNTIIGLQIENLVLANRKLIQKALAIHPIDIICDNPYFQRPTQKRQGCQVDYVIQLRFNTLYICEIKYSKNTISKNVIEQVKNKIDAMEIPKNMSIRPVLIYAGQIDAAIEDSCFFSHIINLCDFLEEE